MCSFPIILAEVTPIHPNKTTFPQVVDGEDFPKRSGPTKESNLEKYHISPNALPNDYYVEPKEPCKKIIL